MDIKNIQKNKLILYLISFLSKKYKIKKRNILGHSDIAPDRKKDPGEKFPWRYLAKKNICVWHNLDQSILKILRKKKCNDIMKNFFLTNLFKIGYVLNTRNYFKKSKNLTFVIKAFQRRFRPELIDGKIDQECLLISQKLI